MHITNETKKMIDQKSKSNESMKFDCISIVSCIAVLYRVVHSYMK